MRFRDCHHRRQSATSIRRLAPGLLVVCLLAGGEAASGFCVASAEVARELSDHRVDVTLRDVEGSAAKEGCVLGIVEAPAEQVFAVLDDPGRFREFMPRVLVSEVEEEEDGTLLNRQVLNLPFPISNRYYTIRVESHGPVPERPDRWEIAWSYVPDSGNVNENEGGWSLLRLSRDRTLVAYRVHTDPAGFIPKWALNRVTRETLPSVIDAVRRRVDELFAGGEPELGGDAATQRGADADR